MFDSVNFILTQDEVGGVDFMAEIPRYLDNVGEHVYSNGGVTITGMLGGLYVSVSPYRIKVYNGSMCKWFLGNNYHTLSRRDTQHAIEKLSDLLHMPMNSATVTRLDMAQNFIMQYPIEVYLNHLGVLRGAARLRQQSGLYYTKRGGLLCFYDKNREQKDKGEPIPEIYAGRNVLRYEQRYTSRLGKQLNVPRVTGALLYDERFYRGLVDRWRDIYKNIHKINDIELNLQAMRTVKDLQQMGILSLVERAGGQLQFLDLINEKQKRGELTRKEAYDMRQRVNKACENSAELVTPNEAIQELDKKVSEAVRFYR